MLRYVDGARVRSRQHIPRKGADRMRNAFFFAAGLGFLGLAKAKHMLSGYSAPKPITDIDGGAQYDIAIAARYLDHLAALGETIEGKRVLELGPGSTWRGTLAAQRRAANYTAFHRFPLAKNAPSDIYEALREKATVDPSRLAEIRYEIDPSFNSCEGSSQNNSIWCFLMPPSSILMMSRKLPATCASSSRLALSCSQRSICRRTCDGFARRTRTISIAIHAGSIGMFYFPGQPNRVASDDYRRLLADWADVRMMSANQFDSSGRSVHSAFRADPHLNWLSSSWPRVTERVLATHARPRQAMAPAYVLRRSRAVLA